MNLKKSINTLRKIVEEYESCNEVDKMQKEKKADEVIKSILSDFDSKIGKLNELREQLSNSNDVLKKKEEENERMEKGRERGGEEV